MKLLFSLLLAGSLLVGCKKNGSGNNNPGNLAELNMKNVSYGSDAAQKMDIYLPANRTSSSTKILVLIHGGGWTAGDKSEFDAYITGLQQRLPGYAIFNINYRLANNNANRFPAQENDVKTAMDFIAGHMKEYYISQNVVLMGFSAGAHLALLQGYKYTSPIKPRAIISFFGPTDLVDMHAHPVSMYAPLLLEALLGTTPQQNLNTYQQSSPIFFVNSASPPTLLLHGGKDDLVAYSQSEMLRDKLKSVGVVNQYVFYPNEGHGWFGATLEDSFDKIEVFLDANVK